MPGLVDPARRSELTESMVHEAGVVRRPEQLDALAAHLDKIVDGGALEPNLHAWETTNLHTIAVALVGAARRRAESRGCHRRSDIDHPLPEWRVRVVSTVREGVLTQDLTAPLAPMPAAPSPLPIPAPSQEVTP